MKRQLSDEAGGVTVNGTATREPPALVGQYAVVLCA